MVIRELVCYASVFWCGRKICSIKFADRWHIGHGYACICLWEISSEQPKRFCEHMITIALLATCGCRRITSDTGEYIDGNAINIVVYR
jgi:hypothetical protein